MNLIPIQKTLTNSKIRFWILGHEMIENDLADSEYLCQLNVAQILSKL